MVPVKSSSKSISQELYELEDSELELDDELVLELELLELDELFDELELDDEPLNELDEELVLDELELLELLELVDELDELDEELLLEDVDELELELPHITLSAEATVKLSKSNVPDGLLFHALPDK